MYRAGREPDWTRIAAAGRMFVEAFEVPPVTPTAAFVPGGSTPTRVVPNTPTPDDPRPTPGRAATPTPPPVATRAAAPNEFVLTREELDSQLQRAIDESGVPLRDATVRLVPSDRVLMNGQMPVAIFLVPLEMEARVSIDGGGKVQVRTTRVEAVGAQLPDGIAQALGQRIDDQGTAAVAKALPRDSRARSVRVEPERIVVEVARG
jgi:hypothetical protein